MDVSLLEIATGATPIVVCLFVTIGFAVLRSHVAHMEHARRANDDARRQLESLAVELRGRLATLESQSTFQSDRLLSIEKHVATGAPLPVTAVPKGESARCPFCHAVVCGSEGVTRCLSCSTDHHDECYRDHGRCAVFGCGGKASASGARSQIATLS